MYDQKQMVTVGSGVSAIILMLVGLFTTEWRTGSEQVMQDPDTVIGKKGKMVNVDMDVGLWSACANFSGVSKCNTINSSDVPATLWIIRILLILAVLMLIVGFVVHLRTPQHKQLVTVLFGLSGLMAIVACILWVTNSELKPSGASLGYSWYLTLVGGVLALGSAGAEEFM